MNYPAAELTGYPDAMLMNGTRIMFGDEFVGSP
jgi:hypothetical protein